MLSELDELAARVEEIRGEAARVGERLALLPDERAAAAAAPAEADEAVAERRSAHAAAQARVADAEAGDDDDRIAAARRDEVRARDLLRSAERRAERARAEEARLAEEDDALRRVCDELAARAAGLAEELRRRPGLAEVAPPPGSASPVDLAAWATEARAALFVARGRLASERDAVIRQANELGTLVLGEPLTAQSAALVARRVEQARSH